MPRTMTRKLIDDHLVDGTPEPGEEIALEIDQTLTQDATGTMVMLELEAMGLDRVKTEVSAQYVDHNLLQTDFRNPDDHLFLRSACRRFGVWFSRLFNRSRLFVIGVLLGYAFSVLVGFVLDALFFPGQGHPLHTPPL